MTFAEYTQLVKTIDHHMELYYNEDTPEISDFEYDALMRQLKSAEKEHPEWVTPDSPSQKVGGRATGAAEGKIKHNVPMLSIEDVSRWKMSPRGRTRCAPCIPTRCFRWKPRWTA